jgi:glutaredoxin-like protein NrdH
MDVVVYTKPACVQCDATKRLMDKLKIKYSTVDISEDEDALNKILGMGYMAAPVVIADGDSWSGFNPDKVKALAE